VAVINVPRGGAARGVRNARAEKVLCRRASWTADGAWSVMVCEVFARLASREASGILRHARMHLAPGGGAPADAIERAAMRDARGVSPWRVWLAGEFFARAPACLMRGACRERLGARAPTEWVPSRRAAAPRMPLAACWDVPSGTMRVCLCVRQSICSAPGPWLAGLLACWLAGLLACWLCDEQPMGDPPSGSALCGLCLPSVCRTAPGRHGARVRARRDMVCFCGAHAHARAAGWRVSIRRVRGRVCCLPSAPRLGASTAAAAGPRDGPAAGNCWRDECVMHAGSSAAGASEGRLRRRWLAGARGVGGCDFGAHRHAGGAHAHAPATARSPDGAGCAQQAGSLHRPGRARPACSGWTRPPLRRRVRKDL
jgi:hypothetical protein